MKREKVTIEGATKALILGQSGKEVNPSTVEENELKKLAK